ncbi:MAG: DSD1 family PLP-dependent enzyme [Deltaproteobacteria bacterium]|nr:DSD1 family PLP-dependent enzyme [Deltaproteobacteria bacterium]
MRQQQEVIGTSKWELDTPCLVIEKDILKKNIQTMQAHANACAKQIRPHAKTHKCSHIAQMQMEAGCTGICVAKVAEAEGLVEKGFQGVVITSPVVTDYKIERLMKCLSRDRELMVVVDNAGNAGRLNAAAEKHGLKLNILVDLDPGMGRTGVPFSEGLALGKLIDNLPSLRLCGVQCYAGHVQHISSFAERSRASLDWMKQAAEVVGQFRASDLPCKIFTGAGTGTFEIDCRIPELTDLQVGSYTMMDAEYINIGSSQDPSRFTQFPPALTLLTTVISVNRPNFVTVDAGLKALYHHGGTPYVLNPSGSGFQYEWFGDEQGRIITPNSSPKLSLGKVLELVVSHCDPTVNLFDVLYVIRNEIVTNIWPIDLRGRCQ